MLILSWNVNGLRAVLKKGFREFMEEQRPDVLCLQEIKARPADLAGVSWPDGYELVWNPATRPGYSGTLVFTRTPPLSVSLDLGLPEHDGEGRVVTVELPECFVVNVYTPNSGSELARLPYRCGEWDPAFLAHVKKLEQAKPVIVCGDLNVAHEEIDLANPRTNTGNAGFTPQEREGFRALLASGLHDTFRDTHPGEPGHYSWWTYRAGARARNIGWRIDYVLVSAPLSSKVRRAFILPQVLGSDHCPVGAEIEF